jgi:hypothetical protein
MQFLNMVFLQFYFFFPIKWAEKCMAKELLNPNGGPNSQYHILLAKIKLAKNQLEEAERHITESLVFDYQVYII